MTPCLQGSARGDRGRLQAVGQEASAILADEPASLDAANGHEVMAILSAIAEKRGRAVLVVTHDPRLFGFADRIIHIEDGALPQPSFTRGRRLATDPFRQQ
jgi:ABC-type lipoprotein export system ATPase subunit